MKKIISFFLALTLSFSLSACGTEENNSSENLSISSKQGVLEDSSTTGESESNEEVKILVAYFS